MLASLLPGLRDLRTPLVTGYLYLLAIWMTYGASRLLPGETNTFASRLVDLRELIGISLEVASLSVAAYLIGSLLVIRSTAWLENALLPQARLSGRWRDPFWSVVDVFERPWRWLVTFLWRPGQASRDRLDGWLREEATDLHRRGVDAHAILSDPALPGRFTKSFGQIWEHQFPAERAKEDGLDWNDETVQFAYESDRSLKALENALTYYVLYQENEALIVRLQIEQPPLFDAYDRLQSESEFRLSIFLPLSWISIVAAFLLTPWAALFLMAPMALGYQGLRLQGQAQERITQALASGAIDSPILQQLRTVADATGTTAALSAADQRSDESAMEFLEGLEDLEERLIAFFKRRASRERSEEQAESQGDLLQAIWKSASKLEYATFGLNQDPREALTRVLPILRYAYDLGRHVDFGSDVDGYHPDTSEQIFEETGKYARSVLESARRRESAPRPTPAVDEYLLALDDRAVDRAQAFAVEQAEYEEPIATFRTGHGLPPSRPSS